MSTPVAGIVAGADSIGDMSLLRHGGMGRLCTGRYAPSKLGSFLRSSVFGHCATARHRAARPVANLARHCPLLRDVGQIAYLDVDDRIRATYGYAKQAAGYGYSAVKGLNALLAALSNPGSARCDRLKGLLEAITTTWEYTIVQQCIVDLIRASFRYAGRQHRDAIVKALKPVYTAPSEAAANERFAEFAAEWDSATRPLSG